MSVSLRCIVNCVALISGLPVIHTAHAQDTVPLLVRVEDRGRVGPRNRVVVRDPQTGGDREVYRSDGTVMDEVVLSPTGNEIAFFEVTGTGRGQIVIIDVSGRMVHAEKVVDRALWQYSWCCGSGKIAILTGGTSEDTRVKPESLYVVDVRTGTRVQIAGIGRIHRIHWASFDSSLYIKGFPPTGSRGQASLPPVYRYLPSSGRLSLTTHRGIVFSPDGLYYFDPSVEGSEARVYRTSDDQDVTQRLALPHHQIERGPEFGWMPGAGHVLLFIERPPRPERQPGEPRLPLRLMDRNTPQLYPDRWNLAVDAETGRVIDRFQGDLGAGWKTNAAALPVERRTGIDLVRARRP